MKVINMKALVAIDKNRAIGLKGGMLFHLPTDLAHFKAHTIGKTIVIGRNTLQSFKDGKPLPGAEKKMTIMLHKPRGEVTTLHDEQGRRDLRELLRDIPQRLVPVGRLDWIRRACCCSPTTGSWPIA